MIDYDTGLQWEKKAGGTCSNALVLCLFNADCPGGTCVGDEHFVDNGYTWADAESFVNGTSPDGSTLTAFASFAGHSDWRLPTIIEIQTILLAPYPCATSPCIDPIFGPTSTRFYWSATSDAANPSAAWSVVFGSGQVSPSTKAAIADVRAVRSGL